MGIESSGIDGGWRARSLRVSRWGVRVAPFRGHGSSSEAEIIPRTEADAIVVKPRLFRITVIIEMPYFFSFNARVHPLHIATDRRQGARLAAALPLSEKGYWMEERF
ncbi:hypothetical protein CEXT_752251 [Caerostris extrusa]|uniref:Uncharacterized protein n=1 Tax=Caerostris extrusa TaxID=172846 RepID=A0AAV4QJ29_CAEEX|nr:hypothetical protein CEXT_752251 [Caerostris extrusa]